MTNSAVSGTVPSQKTAHSVIQDRLRRDPRVTLVKDPDTKNVPGKSGRFCKDRGMPSSSGDGSGFRLADFALAIEGGALFHLETDSIHRAQDDEVGERRHELKVSLPTGPKKS